MPGRDEERHAPFAVLVQAEDGRENELPQPGVAKAGQQRDAIARPCFPKEKQEQQPNPGVHQPLRKVLVDRQSAGNDREDEKRAKDGSPLEEERGHYCCSQP